MTGALTCSGIDKMLGDRHVLHDLDIEVQKGEIVSLLGASGSGKTTLLRIIAGLLMPDRGRIEMGGSEIWSAQRVVPAEQRRIGMVFQDYALWPHMTVEGNLAFGLKSQKLSATERDARIAHALEVTQLGHLRQRHPAALSGGQQQRVAIARCLAARPHLMLFDEPLSNLDAALREDLRTEMVDLVRREAITVIYVTHDQAEAMAVSDRIAVMREGMIAQFDTPQALYAQPATPFVAGFIGGFSLLGGTATETTFTPTGAAPLRISGAARGPALLVIRPEDAQPAAANADCCLSGVVSTAAFQGRCWPLTVQIGMIPVRIDWMERVAPGSMLGFSLPPERSVLLTA
ncbi:MAG: ABC transporter ATP-binding protein [Devosia sp.]